MLLYPKLKNNSKRTTYYTLRVQYIYGAICFAERNANSKEGSFF